MHRVVFRSCPTVRQETKSRRQAGVSNQEITQDEETLGTPHGNKPSQRVHGQGKLIKGMVMRGMGISPLSAATTPINPPAPVEIDGEPAYAICALWDSRRRNGTLQYLVDLEGYGPEEQSWVPRADVPHPSMLADFHAAHPDRPGPQGPGRPRTTRPRASGAGRQMGGIVTNPRNNHQPLHSHAHSHPPLI
ncbi:hypothetical protein P4O66_004323 [Electrophorus voltai]|uniref:Chromo domain-containing protein n=1 Tax=Electrophorus voltai TaxID=2609070 RepID=A0AAD9DKG2_9TELE|nr:hypothetical protein P4O66_004323 [Electrophorus voltai]